MTWMPRYLDRYDQDAKIIGQICWSYYDLDAKENLLDSDSWAPVLLLIQDGKADLQNVMVIDETRIDYYAKSSMYIQM